MKKILFVIALVAVNVFQLSAKDEVLMEGHKAGQWTMDYEAAKAYAQKTGLPIVLNFTGSDWCHWCIKMEDQVFSKEAWSTYAKDNLVQVFIDFPQDKSKVPEKYVARNAQMRDSFGVRGYPSYVILDGKSGEKLGQLGASEESTADSFIAQVKDLTRYTEQEIAKLLESVESSQKEKVTALAKTLKSSEQELLALEKDYAQRKATLLKKLAVTKAEVKAQQEFVRLKAAGYSSEEAKKCLELLAKESEVQSELNAWLETRPERNDENMLKYEAFNKQLKEIRTQLSKF